MSNIPDNCFLEINRGGCLQHWTGELFSGNIENGSSGNLWQLMDSA